MGVDVEDVEAAVVRVSKVDLRSSACGVFFEVRSLSGRELVEEFVVDKCKDAGGGGCPK